MAEETPATVAAEAAEIRRRRLRLLTLGEILAVAALIISGLTFWNSYEERRHSEAEKSASAVKESRAARTILLTAKADKDGGKLTIAAQGGQAIQSQTIAFPASLGISPVDSSDPRIERRWFDDTLIEARKDAGEKARSLGDARLPVAITTRFFSDGALVEETALYDVGYTTSSSFLGGTEIKLKGLSLIGRAAPAAAQKRVDALWSVRHPRAKP